MSRPQNDFAQNLQATMLARLFNNQQSRVVFRGETLNATPKEIFLEGETNMRLLQPLDSVIWVDYRALAVIQTDSGTLTHHASRGSFITQRVAGAATLVGTSAGYAAASGNPAVLGASGTAGHCAFTINAGATDAEDYHVCTVTGASNQTIEWLVEADVICVPYPAVQNRGGKY